MHKDKDDLSRVERLPLAAHGAELIEGAAQYGDSATRPSKQGIQPCGCWIGESGIPRTWCKSHSNVVPPTASELLEALKAVVSSAHPSEVEHPAMFQAWQLAHAVIARAE